MSETPASLRSCEAEVAWIERSIWLVFHILEGHPWSIAPVPHRTLWKVSTGCCWERVGTGKKHPEKHRVLLCDRKRSQGLGGAAMVSRTLALAQCSHHWRYSPVCIHGSCVSTMDISLAYGLSRRLYTELRVPVHNFGGRT